MPVNVGSRSPTLDLTNLNSGTVALETVAEAMPNLRLAACAQAIRKAYMNAANPDAISDLLYDLLKQFVAQVG